MELAAAILSEITIFQKYARYLPQVNRRETWSELVTRNKEMHLKKYPALAAEIESAYSFVYDKKVLSSMRSLQFAGKPIDLNPVRIYNCSFLPMDDVAAFSELMFLLLSGVGVGYSVQRHHIEKLPEINPPTKSKRYLIGDSLEGWADAVKVLLKAYFTGRPKPEFDFSDIRPKGARLVTSGGKAPGPEPLKNCLQQLQRILDRKQRGDRLSSLEVHDINCFIADAVLAGGIRRSAMIALFSFDDQEMLTCKFGAEWEATDSQRGRANNSAVILRHKIEKADFLDLWEKIQASKRGEPGFFFTNDKEWGLNPCAEISLRPFQFCNLTTINVSDVYDQTELNNRAVAAAFIGTLQASYTDFHYLRDIWKKTTEKDALIGVSMTGIASGGVLKLDLAEAAELVKTTNATTAKKLGINKAARCTTVKPEGTTSCVLGSSSGIHAWHSDHYLRRMRIGKNEALYTYLTINHPELLEDDFFRPHRDAVITVPQKAPEGAITREESALQLLGRVSKVWRTWVKPGHRSGHNVNNVSTTVTVKDNEWGDVGDWMWKHRDEYTALAVLPYDDHQYKQAPFEDITKKEYERLVKTLQEVKLDGVVEMRDDTERQEALACAGNACEVR